MDTAVLVWNGTSVVGCAEIQQFLEKLPSSEHHVMSLDAQPLHGTYLSIEGMRAVSFILMNFTEEAIKGQNTVMIVVAGNVRFEKKPAQGFCQNFLVTAQGTKWKVVSDCLRFQQTLT